MLARCLRIVLCLLLLAHLPVSGNEQNDSLLLLVGKADNKEKIRIYHELFDIALKEEDFDRAQNLADTALHLAEKANNKEEQYNSLMELERVSSAKGDAGNAIDYEEKALIIAKALGSSLMIARTSNELGINYSNISVFDKALSNYLVSLKIIEDTLPGLPMETALKYKSLIQNNIGVMYSKMGNDDKALDYYEQALKIRKNQQEKYGIASTLQNVGVIFERKKEFKKALEIYKEALIIRESLSSQNDIAELLMNIGIIQIKTDQLDSATYNLKKAITIFGSTGDKLGYSNVCLNLAELYQKKEKADSAFRYMETALSISKEQNYRSIQGKAHQLLSDYYAAKGNYSKAWQNLSALLRVKDTVYNSELVEKISEMQTKYETEKKEKEIKILARDKEIQYLKIRKQSTQLYLLLAFILLAGIILTLIFSRIKLRQKHVQAQLEKKNLETEQRLLRSQMNPHFIFNSMNSIQSYISGNDSFTAMTYLSKFAQLMRNILDNSRKSLIALSDEINTLELYMELERIRFNKKFDFKITVEPGLPPETIYIPPMLIQPFVENSIKHGLRNKEGHGLLEIEFKQTHKLLSCTLKDNGIGREKALEQNMKKNKSHRSLGMQVTQERLEALSKEKKISINFEITDLKNNNGKVEGTQVVIQMPYETD